jgi:hypothetical protein
MISDGQETLMIHLTRNFIQIQRRVLDIFLIFDYKATITTIRSRFNGEVRDREKVMRGLKRKYTPILTGYQIYDNYIRPHEGLNGKTPAYASGIKIEG